MFTRTHGGTLIDAGSTLGLRRRLREAAPPPSQASVVSPMQAPEPQVMTTAGFVVKNQPFTVIDSECRKWTVPAGTYGTGKDSSDWCSTTYTPTGRQVAVTNRDCCGRGND